MAIQLFIHYNNDIHQLEVDDDFTKNELLEEISDLLDIETYKYNIFFQNIRLIKSFKNKIRLLSDIGICTESDIYVEERIFKDEREKIEAKFGKTVYILYKRLIDFDNLNEEITLENVQKRFIGNYFDYRPVDIVRAIIYHYCKWTAPKSDTKTRIPKDILLRSIPKFIGIDYWESLQNMRDLNMICSYSGFYFARDGIKELEKCQLI